eukprot:CAMPEP_0180272564 /NCGR_PEP_ID=MMETSP0988-20121125/4311_1 /TAXON_ID=697907 /ORGANISM="non described non described, Strain CCMP2293" /LENGTH=122 /DNA_ID=CAMNT_0022243641 /DNA_START=121 /DNA_END=489 /DNA_ORIENTATION=+
MAPSDTQKFVYVSCLGLTLSGVHHARRPRFPANAVRHPVVELGDAVPSRTSNPRMGCGEIRRSQHKPRVRAGMVQTRGAAVAGGARGDVSHGRLERGQRPPLLVLRRRDCLLRLHQVVSLRL